MNLFNDCYSFIAKIIIGKLINDNVNWTGNLAVISKSVHSDFMTTKSFIQQNYIRLRIRLLTRKAQQELALYLTAVIATAVFIQVQKKTTQIA